MYYRGVGWGDTPRTGDTMGKARVRPATGSSGLGIVGAVVVTTLLAAFMDLAFGIDILAYIGAVASALADFAQGTIDKAADGGGR